MVNPKKNKPVSVIFVFVLLAILGPEVLDSNQMRPKRPKQGENRHCRAPCACFGCDLLLILHLCVERAPCCPAHPNLSCVVFLPNSLHLHIPLSSVLTLCIQLSKGSVAVAINGTVVLLAHFDRVVPHRASSSIKMSTLKGALKRYVFNPALLINNVCNFQPSHQPWPLEHS